MWRRNDLRAYLPRSRDIYHMTMLAKYGLAPDRNSDASFIGWLEYPQQQQPLDKLVTWLENEIKEQWISGVCLFRKQAIEPRQMYINSINHPKFP